MLKHVILWRLDSKLSEVEKEKVKTDTKRELEALVGLVPGLISMSVTINGIESSNADMMLDSTLEGVEALNVYRVHPEHVRVADYFIRPYTTERLCLDYII